MLNDSLFSSDKHDWETPDWLFDQLNKEFHFDLDVCASNKNAKCSLYFSEEQDALNISWYDFANVCWCNPPYGRKIGKWVEKAYKEAQIGVTVVMLIPARTDTKYFHQYIWDKENHRPKDGVEVRFLEGRLKFKGAKHSAPFPSMIVVFRGD